MARPSTVYLDEAVELESMLAPFLRTSDARYQKANWLKNGFDEPVWVIESSNNFEIDWRIVLPDGLLLTAPPHAALLESLKSWLIATTHVDSTGGQIYAPITERKMLGRTLHLIDYLLLRADSLGLVKQGLSGFSQNDFRAMIAAIGNQRTATNSIYEWDVRLSEYLRSQILTLSPDAIDRARHLIPDLADGIPDPIDRLTSLSDEEIVSARAWLALTNLYSWGRNGYRISPQIQYFVDALYAGTVFGRSSLRSVPTELCIGPEHFAQTEYPRARVISARDERMGIMHLSGYVDMITPLALLHAERLEVPLIHIDDLKQFARTLDTKPSGRFRTLPQDVVFSALRSAVEFAIEFGDELIDSYLLVTQAAYQSRQSIAALLTEDNIERYLTDACKQLGVCQWTIEPLRAGLGCPRSFAKSEWYRQLRNNVGLWEMLLVLYGAIQIVVGTLTARRSSELVDLMSGSCLDEERTRLFFGNGKSGFGGIRELEARPIPPIGARLITMLERLQKGLIHIGVMTSETNLFAHPRRQGRLGLVKIEFMGYSSALDLFCDWSQTSLDKEKKRYYLRHHQLRRFFAMLFFWGGGFGGLDTLRWFLGHTNSEHVWHYITESTPGITIRSVAAEWAVYGIKHAMKESEQLAAELAQHFGTSDFSVLEEEALTLHLEDLMEEGRLTIEPQFLDNGTQYRIAVILRSKDLP